MMEVAPRRSVRIAENKKATMSNHHEIEAILSCGTSLEAFGVINWGLTKSQALSALETFRAKQIPVLGGDVWIETNPHKLQNCDNWHCEPQPKEKLSDFVERSTQTAQTYIAGYPADDRKVLFELVPLDSSTVLYHQLLYHH